MKLIFGGLTGIGHGIYTRLKENGDSAITLSRTVKVDCNDHISCDVTNQDSLKEAYRQIKKMNKPVDSLINCAGIASLNLALTTPKTSTEKIIRTNLIGTIFACQTFAPLLVRNNYGRIINFSSIAVHKALPGESIYSASKAGVESFSHILAKELAPFNITVNCIAPGPIRTKLLSGVSDTQIKNIIGSQIIKKELNIFDIADIACMLLKPESSYITGQTIIPGGL